jgi:hypothetical protein
MTKIHHIKQTAMDTPEPWQYGCTPHACNGLPHKVFVDGEEVASCGKEANARRICAAVNAFEGIPTEALEQGIVVELRRALELFLEFSDQWLIATDNQADLEHDRIMQMARTALTKAKRNAQ